MIVINDLTIINLVRERTLPHLADLKFHRHSLEWLAMACYMQGVRDLIQCLEDQDDKTRAAIDRLVQQSTSHG